MTDTRMPMTGRLSSATRLSVRIRGSDPPGLYFCSSDPDTSSIGPVHVGIQHGREVVDLVPGDVPEAVFELYVDVGAARDGRTDFKGPYVHGKLGDRFLYLGWGRLDASGGFQMFRRAKLLLGSIPSDDLRRAIDTGSVLEAHLPLSDRCGEPICASIRPPTLRWYVAPAPPTT